MATADKFGLFWNSDAGDRKYNADSFEKWLKKFFTSGVFEGDMQVTASSGMTVQVGAGYTNQAGKVGLFETVNRITLDAAHSSYPRIDTIVVERNDSDREISLKKITGAYSGNMPVPTPRVWDETNGIYQLVLAQIYVGAGVSAITQANITDTRPDPNLCGYIAGTVEEMDFSQFTAQFEAYFSQFEATNLAEFEAWFEHMKDQLDEDAAGHLQNEIDALDLRVDDTESDIETINTFIGKRLPAQTLAAGSTSLTFTDSSITTASTIEPYASVYGVAPKNITVTSGRAVLTFKAQQTAVSVYLIIR